MAVLLKAVVLGPQVLCALSMGHMNPLPVAYLAPPPPPLWQRLPEEALRVVRAKAEELG